jgi:hypothetical protein
MRPSQNCSTCNEALAAGDLLPRQGPFVGQDVGVELGQQALHDDGVHAGLLPRHATAAAPLQGAAVDPISSMPEDRPNGCVAPPAAGDAAQEASGRTTTLVSLGGCECGLPCASQIARSKTGFLAAFPTTSCFRPRVDSPTTGGSSRGRAVS